MVNQRQRVEAASHPGAEGTVFVSNGDYGVWSGGLDLPLDLYAPNSGDWDDAFSEAIAVASVFGGTVLLPAGEIPISGEVSWPTGVSVWGQGGQSRGSAVGSRVVATGASARFRFGVRGTGSFGGLSGNFVLDGDDISANMLILGRTLERTFENISVVNCAAGSYAVIVEEAQNCAFIQILVNSNAGGGLSFDIGAAGLRFFGVEARENGVSGGYHLRLTASLAIADPTAYGVVAYPLRITFYDSIFEDDGGLLDGAVYMGAGQDIGFVRCNLAAGAAATRAFPLFKMEVGDAGITSVSTRAVFVDCEFTGTDTQTTGLDLDDASVIHLVGPTVFQGLLNRALLRDASSQVWLDRRLIESAVTNKLAAGSVGAISSTFRIRTGDPLEMTTPTINDVIAIYTVAGETGARRIDNPYRIGWGSGSSFTMDAFLERGAADRLTMGSGDAFRTGAIAALPAASAAYRGYLYRVEGGAGVADALYVCEKDAADAYVWRAL